MNIRESIRKSLREHREFLKIRRNLNKLPNYVRSTYKWLEPKRFNSFDEFINRVIFSATRDFVADFREPQWSVEDYYKASDKMLEPITDIVMRELYQEIHDYYYQVKK